MSGIHPGNDNQTNSLQPRAATTANHLTPVWYYSFTVYVHQETPGKSSPVKSVADNFEDGSGDLLEVEAPSSSPTPEFNYDERPPSISTRKRRRLLARSMPHYGRQIPHLRPPLETYLQRKISQPSISRCFDAEGVVNDVDLED